MNEFIGCEDRLIGDGYNYTIGVSVVDLTGTGSLDLVSTDTDVGLYWCENDGNGNFTKHVVHERSNEWLERHAIADINGDGRLDIVACAERGSNELRWWRNMGPARQTATAHNSAVTLSGSEGPGEGSATRRGSTCEALAPDASSGVSSA